MDKQSRDWAKALSRSNTRATRLPKKVGTYESGELLSQRLPMTDMKNQQQCVTTAIDTESDVSNPVYRQISFTNGQINRMSLDDIKSQCKTYNLECTGSRDAVKRRLKEHLKELMLIEAGLSRPKERNNVDYFVVIDYEATCEAANPADYKHEIIEFPAILVSSEPGNACIVDTFHSFVRPVINTQLSTFCKDLTGITQSIVDKARPFPEVHADFLCWLHEKHQLGSKHTFAIVTDGPFDMGRFLFLQMNHIRQPFPEYGKNWVNIRKSFVHFYKGESYYQQQQKFKSNNKLNPLGLPGLQTMLEKLGMTFEGQPHSGLDDSRNIARVLLRMIDDKAVVRINEQIRVDNEEGILHEVNIPKLKNVMPVTKKQYDEWLVQQRKLIQDAIKAK